MKCPNCNKQTVVVLKKKTGVGLYYIECPTMNCWAIKVKDVKA